MLSTIVNREGAFDTLLQDRAPGAPTTPALIETARAWSDAVWDAARHARPDAIERVDRERGLALARRPVFVCGAHRSGTTLLRDLLDGHPALSVLPSEGSYFTSLGPHLASRPPDERLRVFACEWTRRMANPTNQPPYWLLGRSVGTVSPYVGFVRALAQWWTVSEQGLPGITSWPLVAVALTYAARSSQLSRAKWWVEKTPTNERFEARLRAEFPDAVIVHMVRHPLAVVASRKRQEMRVFGAFRQAQRALGELADSYRIALARRATPRYHVLRYEDLIADPAATMARLARTLEVENTRGLLEPTVAGHPVAANSSFSRSRASRGVIVAETNNHPAEVLTAREQRRVAATIEEAAASFGYELPRVRGWTRILSRLRTMGSKLEMTDR